jgi:hypothetical protein
MSQESDDKIPLSEIAQRLREQGRIPPPPPDLKTSQFGRLKFAVSMLVWSFFLLAAFHYQSAVGALVVFFAVMLPIALRLGDVGMSRFWLIIFLVFGIPAFFPFPGELFLIIPLDVIAWLLVVRLFAAPTDYAQTRQPDRSMKIVVIAGITVVLIFVVKMNWEHFFE